MILSLPSAGLRLLPSWEINAYNRLKCTVMIERTTGEELLSNRSRAGQTIMSVPTGIRHISSRVPIQSVGAVRQRSTLTSWPSPFMAGETPCGAAANTSRHTATTFTQGQTFYAMCHAVPANHVMLMPCYVNCPGPPCPHSALCCSLFPQPRSRVS